MSALLAILIESDVQTTDMQVVEICREQLNFALPSLQLDRRCRNFDCSPVTVDLVKFVLVDVFCIFCTATITW